MSNVLVLNYKKGDFIAIEIKEYYNKILSVLRKIFLPTNTIRLRTSNLNPLSYLKKTDLLSVRRNIAKLSTK